MVRRIKTKARQVPKKIVEWVDKTGFKPAPFAREIPTYCHTEQSTSVPLVIGGLYSTLYSFNKKYFDDPSVGFLFRACTWDNPEVVIGSLLIYAGTKRIDQRASSNKIVSALKHVFIAAGGMYVMSPNDVAYVA